MKIGMIDIDILDNGTRHPNLAQMKMSAFCKGRSHTVELIFKNEDLDRLDEYDVLLVSKVFSSTKLPEQIEKMCDLHSSDLSDLNLCVHESIGSFEKERPRQTQILIGGSGFFQDGGKDLHDDIEHCMPDYSLYDEYVDYKISKGRNASYFKDYMEYSIGFTSRGCFRKCEFCINKKYDRCERSSPVSEFFDKRRKAIYLWDDNVLACKDWEIILDELDATRYPFQFRQGLDIRLLSEKKAQRLSESRYNGDFIFAFDRVDDRDLIEKKLEMWRRYTKKETKLYLICAYDSWKYTDPSELGPESGPHLTRMANLKTQKERDLLDIEQLFERIKVLIDYHCLPYVMRYEKYRDSEYRDLYIQIARWCNQPRMFKKTSFRQFCEVNQAYHKNPKTKCAAYRVMLDFEKAHPNIAKKYYDLRFDEENQYGKSSDQGARRAE